MARVDLKIWGPAVDSVFDKNWVSYGEHDLFDALKKANEDPFIAVAWDRDGVSEWVNSLDLIPTLYCDDTWGVRIYQYAGIGPFWSWNYIVKRWGPRFPEFGQEKNPPRATEQNRITRLRRVTKSLL